MPELPEVETVRRTLAPILGARLTSVSASGLPLRLGAKVPVAGLRKLVGCKVVALRRLGKYLLLDVEGDKGILVHLGMSGRLRVFDAGEATALHTHLRLGLEAGRELRYSDPRRFGQISLYQRGREREHPALAVLGPDPLDESLDGAALLLAQARRRKTPLKAFVLDQRVLAGMGNIYASEALWLARLRPTLSASRLTARTAAGLWRAIRQVLEHALTHGGTTLRDFVAADGSTGEHAGYLQVYGRDATPCPRCRTDIRRLVQQGRATYFCPTCQPP
ncbi:MAG TPA: bifunctional DNA-formamidopyrimidine glycosylase/DNA-(apurinic or apyrimidinic site) lyase [Kofleriaceae bacterium]|nr:bifunctional DNA-formamidopyrimidine glycosylase/DNA-(apurinic or apyrimidinic site) lyase [Kofleriaceae bacterium]